MMNESNDNERRATMRVTSPQCVDCSAPCMIGQRRCVDCEMSRGVRAAQAHETIAGDVHAPRDIGAENAAIGRVRAALPVLAEMMDAALNGAITARDLVEDAPTDEDRSAALLVLSEWNEHRRVLWALALDMDAQSRAQSDALPRDDKGEPIPPRTVSVTDAIGGIGIGAPRTLVDQAERAIESARSAHVRGTARDAAERVAGAMTPTHAEPDHMRDDERALPFVQDAAGAVHVACSECGDDVSIDAARINVTRVIGPIRCDDCKRDD